MTKAVLKQTQEIKLDNGTGQPFTTEKKGNYLKLRQNKLETCFSCFLNVSAFLKYYKTALELSVQVMYNLGKEKPL